MELTTNLVSMAATGVSNRKAARLFIDLAQLIGVVAQSVAMNAICGMNHVKKTRL